VITNLALEVADQLEERGVSTAVITVPTLKPLDREGLSSILSTFSVVTLIEESAPRALGLELQAMAFRAGYKGKLAVFALKDEFIHCYGSHADILAAHGLSVQKIIDRLFGQS
jgi:transketolase